MQFGSPCEHFGTIWDVLEANLELLWPPEGHRKAKGTQKLDCGILGGFPGGAPPGIWRTGNTEVFGQKPMKTYGGVQISTFGQNDP